MRSSTSSPYPALKKEVTKDIDADSSNTTTSLKNEKSTTTTRSTRSNATSTLIKSESETSNNYNNNNNNNNIFDEDSETSDPTAHSEVLMNPTAKKDLETGVNQGYWTEADRGGYRKGFDVFI